MTAISAAASGLARRYASALFDLAEESNALDSVADDLSGMATLIDESAELQNLISNPVLSRETQAAAVAAVGSKAGFGDLTNKFLGVLAQKRRLFALPGVVTAYKEMLASHKGEVTAEVVTATALDAEQRKTVEEAVGRFAGQAVRIESSVDPELLGGLTVRVGSRMLDASLRTKLQNLEMSMRGIG